MVLLIEDGDVSSALATKRPPNLSIAEHTWLPAHMSWEPSVFDYLDYREFLQAYFEGAKQNVPAFSHRYFARRAGFGSSNFVHLVMKGERNLSTESMLKVIKGCQLNAEQADFFSVLVHFNQARTAQEKDEAFEKVAASRRFRQAREIDHSTWEYLSHWYYPAIREMAARSDFRNDPEWIANQLWPPITRAKARNAMKLLLDLGLLVIDEDGSVNRVSVSLTTGHEVRAVGVRNYHRQMLERASEALESKPASLRDVSGMTTCIRRETVDEVKERIRSFRQTLMELCDADENPELVYQINFQMFPLSGSEDD